MTLDDVAAVERARAGDQDAFRVLVDKHSRSLYRLAYRMTGKPEDAEDVVQETFIRAYRQLSRFEARSNVSTWLYRIAFNCSVDFLRSRPRRETATENDALERMAPAATGPTMDDLVYAGQIGERMQVALGGLSEKERAAYEHNHPTEDELVLLFYGDAGADDEPRLTAHLATCTTCQPVWQEIRASLNAVDAAGVPEPPPDFERVMWAKVQREIGDMPAPARRWSPQFWLSAASLAAVVLAVTMATLMWNTTDTTSTTNAANTSQPERALLVAMDEHLERSELLLVELLNADLSQPNGAEAVRLGFEMAAADDLLLSSRLYRQTAAHTGNIELASMLEDLERVLVEIARGPMELKREDLDALRTRITEDDLLFKVRVVNDEVRRRQQAIATVSEGDL